MSMPYEEEPSNLPTRPKEKQSSRPACSACRSVKVRCRAASIYEVCERCDRKGLRCVFEPHKRGRKPGTKINRSGKVVPPQNDIEQSSPASQPTVSDQPTFQAGFEPEIKHASPSTARSHDPTSPRSTTGGIVWGTEVLQPSGILSKEAQSGKFSLASILSVPEVLRRDQTPPLVPPPRTESAGNLSDDPMASGLLTFPVALGLYDSFMRCLNPYISQLDPQLHSLEYIQRKSSLLLTTILAASSKAFHPALHPKLRIHAEKLLGQAFIRGSKTVETIQAISIFTYWKEPDENRAWLLVGYAIRMCIELGFHEMKASHGRSTIGKTEIEERETRNIERTWKILFVYDRSVSLQLGKPWMIHLDDCISNSDEWYKHELAPYGVDLLLCAFTSLRRLSTEMLDLVGSKQNRADMPPKILNNSISSWEQKWLPLFDDPRVQACQKFMVHFYGLHLRLLLNSYSLQASLANAHNGVPIDNSALWLCFSSAVGMLDQLWKVFGPHKQLYFAQDSIHVMTAYAAIFLIKLLVALPDSLRADMETQALHAIMQTADTFEQQCATPTTGCAMQARFLKKVVEKYHSSKHQFLPPGPAPVPDMTSTSTSASQPLPTQANSMYMPNNTQLDTTGLPNYGPGIGTSYATGNGTGLEAPIAFDSKANFDTFADKDMWDALFTDTGFWMGESVFSSDMNLM